LEKISSRAFSEARSRFEDKILIELGLQVQCLQRPDRPTEVGVYSFELSIDIKPMMLGFSS
jgi:hypothetical protein